MDIHQWTQNTLRITQDGYYQLGGRRIDLPHGTQNQVILYTPDDVHACVQQAQSRISTDHAMAEIGVNSLDTYGCAHQYGVGKCLVLNFADAFVPGGGFLTGLSAQEENLCRQSTLYASLAKPEARPLYDFNCRHRLPEGSDYLLVSPDVDVFFDIEGNLLAQPYSVDVLSYAAPNVYDVAEMLTEQQLRQTFLRLIRNILGVAAQRRYDTLVLGAWGCGAFGNRAADVADYFAQVLLDEGFGRLFEKIYFAVYINPRAQKRYNYLAFYKRFMPQ